MAGQSSLFLSAKEKESIRRAVAKAEAGSSGEIVAMVVDQSDRYLEAERLGALLMAALCAVVVVLALDHITIWTYIPVTGLLYFPLFLLFRRFPRLKLSFVGSVRQGEAVYGRAVASFYEKGVYRTRHRTGILIFISLLERKVWILGDTGINEKIPAASWQELAGELAAGLREGRGGAALERVIAACGDELSRHFPRRDGDVNELSDEVVTL